ncbi:DEAD/DEAH box helicase [Flavobacterium sp. 17A]|uniref:DEAD/DEAH box helicase n=1 Tax=Flavobacterium potami TaxID=2872310 RepID=A0A9X1H7C9_9FLAO|nr:DEAD/DEAH box helicase [Flavobacterium potami]MBZ4033815.1 DEAD/DEAH box helicase [Flavobacterium potami]
MILDKHKAIVKYLLNIELQATAVKLQLIHKSETIISDEKLYQAVGVIDHYSRNRDEVSKQLVIVLSSILYSYKQQHWTGLSEFLVVVLSRIGYAPSAIMIDENFDKESNTFGPLNSLISQISTTLNHLKNEISVNGRVFLLTDFQKNVWNKSAESKFLGISAPTSAGKSFVILLKCIKNILERGGNIVYVVPTLSLINQVVNDFHEKLKEFDIDNYEIHTSYIKGKSNNIIYVLTPERAISAYNDKSKPFGDVDSFIVDEIQNIERIENKEDERAKILFDSLIELSFSYEPNLIIFSGPRVSGLKNMGFEIFQEENSNEISTVSSPVTNFTYSIGKKGKKYFLKQYSQIDPEYSVIEVTNSEHLKIGGKQYDDKYLKYLSTFINLLGADTKNIIFSPTSSTARKIAVYLTDHGLPVKKSNSDSLIAYIAETVHPNYDLCKTLELNIAYHHGKVPSHIRNVLEYAIKEKIIENTVCTTTLMQGVNLPAQNVIMRNGYLSTKTINGSMPELTNYEISNLRGRAGRLLKDLIGRTFVLDENAFDSNSDKQADLFKDENKNLKTGYGNIFTNNETAISKAVFENKNIEEITELGKEEIFLVTYIRYNVLKHGLDCMERLSSVGINYDLEDIETIKNELEKELRVPVAICLKNRYVDPLLINDIYLNIKDFTIPTDINSSNLSNALYKLVSRIRLNYPKYYSRFFNRELPETYFYTVVSWMKEKTLREILNGDYFNNSDNIDKKIDDIQKGICFDLTSLLRPFYSIKSPESSIVSCMEMGGYKSLTLQLIALNIPREVALILCKTVFAKVEINKVLEDWQVKEVLRQNMEEIRFWDRIQLQHLD